jgi:hypothetical protein
MPRGGGASEQVCYTGGMQPPVGPFHIRSGNGRTRGPFTTEEIRALAADRRASEHDFYRTLGTEKWVPGTQLVHIFQLPQANEPAPGAKSARIERATTQRHEPDATAAPPISRCVLMLIGAMLLHFRILRMAQPADAQDLYGHGA